MHPWIHQQQLSFANRWRRWRSRQVETLFHLLAIAVVAAILMGPLLDLLARAGARIGQFGQGQPLLLACAWLVASAFVCWRPMSLLHEALAHGRWSSLPASASEGRGSYRLIGWLVTLAVITLSCLFARWSYPDTFAAGVREAGLAAGIGAQAAVWGAARPRRARPVRSVRAAATGWPSRGDFPQAMRYWLRLRVSSAWRTGALSGGGLLLGGLLFPAGSGMAHLLAGLIALLLAVRLMVLCTSSAALIFGADSLLQSQPLPEHAWLRAHRAAVLPEGSLLSTMLAICSYALGAPVAISIVVLMVLLWLLCNEVVLVSRFRRHPRRRTIVWTALATAVVAIGPQAAPLLVLILPALTILLWMTRLK